MAKNLNLGVDEDDAEQPLNMYGSWEIDWVLEQECITE